MLMASQGEKCALGGCHNPRLDESEFCAACLTSGRSNPASRTTCDNLATVGPPIIDLSRPPMPIKKIDDLVERSLQAKQSL